MHGWFFDRDSNSVAVAGSVLVAAPSHWHTRATLRYVNGEIVQDSNTNELVFKTAELLEFISKFVTLLPGDLISTGTPSGVGCFRDPPIFLKHGDLVRCEIDHLGVVENKMVDLSHKRSSM